MVLVGFSLFFTLNFIFLVFMFERYYVTFKYIIIDILGIGKLRVICGWGGGGWRSHMNFHLHVVGLVKQRIYYS